MSAPTKGANKRPRASKPSTTTTGARATAPPDPTEWYRARRELEPAAVRTRRLTRARLDSAIDAASRARVDPTDRHVALAVLADAAWLAEHRSGTDDPGAAALARLRIAAERYLETRAPNERWSAGKHAPTPRAARAARARELGALALECWTHVAAKRGKYTEEAAEVAALGLAGAINALVGRGPSYTPNVEAHRELVTALLAHKPDGEKLVVLALRTAGVDPKSAHDEYGRNIK